MDRLALAEIVSFEAIREAGTRPLEEEEEERLRVAGREAEGRVERLESAIADLTAERDAENGEVAKVNWKLGKLRSVPPEMLSEVYGWCLAGTEDGVGRGRKIGDLRAVCTFWRDAVDGTPSLWTRACTRGHEYAHLAAYGRNSGALPMTFTHDGEGPDDVALVGLTTLGRATSRLTSMKLHLSWNFIGSYMPTPGLDSLTAVDLTLEGEPHPGALTLFTYAKRLESLSIGWVGGAMDDDFVMAVPDFPALCSLALHGLDEGCMKFVSHLLRSTRTIQSAQLDVAIRNVETSDDFVTVGEIEAPRLETLELQGDTSYLLAQLIAPRVKVVTLKDVNNSRKCVDDLAMMLTRPGGCPDLKKLALERVDSGLPGAQGGLTTCLRALGGLKSLQIDDTGIERGEFGGKELFDALAAEAVPLVMPRLERFDYWPPVDGLTNEDWVALDKLELSREVTRTVAGQEVVALHVELDKL